MQRPCLDKNTNKLNSPCWPQKAGEQHLTPQQTQATICIVFISPGARGGSTAQVIMSLCGLHGCLRCRCLRGGCDCARRGGQSGRDDLALELLQLQNNRANC